MQQINEATLPFIDAAWLMAATLLKTQGAVNPLVVLSNRESKSTVFVPSTGISSKEFYVKFVELIVRLQSGEKIDNLPADFAGMADDNTNPDLAVHIAESWMAQVAAKTPAHLAAVAARGLEHYPGRLEVIMVSWKAKGGERGIIIKQINRDAAGIPTIGEQLMGEEFETFSSKMFEHIFN